MSITRAYVENVLILRCGNLMAFAGLDNITVDGNNADLNDPIGWSLRLLDHSVTDPKTVVDADLAVVPEEDHNALLDLAELRTLQSTLGNITTVSYKLGPRSENLSDLAKLLDGRIERLVDSIQDMYGLGASTLQTGMVQLDFAEPVETS